MEIALAGVPVHRALVVELARLLALDGFGVTSARLLNADANGRSVVSLDLGDREAILRCLHDCPRGLSELRSVLIQELQWRRRQAAAVG